MVNLKYLFRSKVKLVSTQPMNIQTEGRVYRFKKDIPLEVEKKHVKALLVYNNIKYK